MNEYSIVPEGYTPDVWIIKVGGQKDAVHQLPGRTLSTRHGLLLDFNSARNFGAACQVLCRDTALHRESRLPTGRGYAVQYPLKSKTDRNGPVALEDGKTETMP
jgi:hypothetical protein